MYGTSEWLIALSVIGALGCDILVRFQRGELHLLSAMSFANIFSIIALCGSG